MQEFKKEHGSGTTTFIISNEEMNIMKIVQALENTNILLKGVTKTGFLSMWLDTLGASLLGNLLKEKELKELVLVIMQKKEKEL